MNEDNQQPAGQNQPAPQEGQPNVPPQAPQQTPPPPPPPPQPPRQPDNPEDITGIDQNRLMAALSYLGVLVLVPLFMKKDDPFIAFHAKQGLVVFIGYIIGSIAIIWLPQLGNLLILLLIIVSVMGVVQAISGKRWRIPGIGNLADKFNI